MSSLPGWALGYTATAAALLVVSALAGHFAWVVESDAPATRVTRATVWLYDIAAWTMFAGLATGIAAHLYVDSGGDSTLGMQLGGLELPFGLAWLTAMTLRKAVRDRWRKTRAASLMGGDGPTECPQCRLVNPPTARRCDCGHEFTS